MPHPKDLQGVTVQSTGPKAVWHHQTGEWTVHVQVGGHCLPGGPGPLIILNTFKSPIPFIMNDFFNAFSFPTPPSFFVITNIFE